MYDAYTHTHPHPHPYTSIRSCHLNVFNVLRLGVLLTYVAYVSRMARANESNLTVDLALH